MGIRRSRPASTFRAVFLYAEEAADGQPPFVLNEWMASFTLQRLRQKTVFRFTLKNLDSNVVLSYPEDYARMLDVFPAELWPEFVKDLPSNGSGLQDALFGAEG